MNESEAIAQLQRGDVRGLEVLVRKYQLEAVRLANSITKDRLSAEELVQEAFIRVFQCIEQYDETRPFRAWFLRIVVNDALKAVKKQSRFFSFGNGYEGSDEDVESFLAESSIWFEQEEFSLSHENAEALKEMLNSLSPEHRAVLELKYYMDMSDEEIAATLNIPRGTVKSRLHNAKVSCRSLLERMDYLSSCR